MILSIHYNKSNGEITVSSDIRIIPVEVNPNSIVDTQDDLNFKVAIDTTLYEQTNLMEPPLA